MFKFAVKNVVIFCGLILVVSFTGCDQIQSIFSGKKSTTSAPPPPTQALVATTAAPAANPSAPLPTNVLAKVGNWTLTLDEFKERLVNLKQALPEYDINDPESKKLILDELVRQQLLVMEAEQGGMANKKEIIDAVNEFKRSLLVREAAIKLTQGIAVSNLEAEDFYNQNKDKIADPAEYHLREIIVYTEAGAKDILVELLKGADFAETAKTRSKSTSAAQGGDLGFVATFPSPQMESAVASLEAGGVSSVFKGPDGYYIIKLEEKRGGAQKDFNSVKNDIVTYLTQLKQQQAILDHLEQLKQKTEVKLNEGLLTD